MAIRWPKVEASILILSRAAHSSIDLFNLFAHSSVRTLIHLLSHSFEQKKKIIIKEQTEVVEKETKNERVRRRAVRCGRRKTIPRRKNVNDVSPCGHISDRNSRGGHKIH